MPKVKNRREMTEILTLIGEDEVESIVDTHSGDDSYDTEELCEGFNESGNQI